MHYTATLNKHCLRGLGFAAPGVALYISNASFWVDGVVSVGIPRDKSSLVSEKKKNKTSLMGSAARATGSWKGKADPAAVGRV